MPTGIQYLDEAINPWRTKEDGWYCEKIATGCRNCYSERVNLGYGDKKPYQKRDVELIFKPEIVQKISHFRKPRKIGICFMDDLFLYRHKFNDIYKIVERMVNYPQHTYFVLTKRTTRMVGVTEECLFHLNRNYGEVTEGWNRIYWGCSVSTQEDVDREIPELLKIPGNLWVSVEPILDNIMLEPFLDGSCLRCYGIGEVSPIEDCLQCSGTGEGNKLSWVIVGSESGSNKRKFEMAWARSLRDQCVEAGAPFFFKQATINGQTVKMPKLDGKVWDQMPRGVNGS